MAPKIEILFEMMMHGFLVALAVTPAAAGISVARAQEAADRSAKDGVYTTVQANQGKTVYDEQCELCHGTLTSVTPAVAPLLNDYVFQTTWNDRSLGELFERIRDTMPQEAPGTLSSAELVELIAYILSANQLPPGDVALPQDTETLMHIRLGAGLP